MQALEEDPLEEESDTEIISKRERMKFALIFFVKAIKRWDEYEFQSEIKSKQEKSSFRQYVNKYNVCHTKLYRRYKEETFSHHKVHQVQQRLTFIEKECLVNWIELLIKWGFSSIIYRIKLQAEEILKKSGNHTSLGCH